MILLQIIHNIIVVVGWASNNARGFGEPQGVREQVMNIIHSTRTVMRSKL